MTHSFIALNTIKIPGAEQLGAGASKLCGTPQVAAGTAGGEQLGALGGEYEEAGADVNVENCEDIPEPDRCDGAISTGDGAEYDTDGGGPYVAAGAENCGAGAAAGSEYDGDGGDEYE